MTLNRDYLPTIGFRITQIMGYGARLGWIASAWWSERDLQKLDRFAMLLLGFQ